MNHLRFLKAGMVPCKASLIQSSGWEECSFLTCSVLPVRVACNLHCSFCFSKSSISALDRDLVDWRRLGVEDYYSFSRDHGASRLVITGGGEPLLRPDVVVDLISRGSKFFDEIACFTNGTYLTRDLSKRLADAGLSYICYSRHSDRDDECKVLMGETAPTLYEFFEASQGLKVRATCVMARGYIDSAEAVWRYIGNLEKFGVTEFTFKHTYVAYGRSIFKDSPQDDWARKHQVEFDPFTGIGEVVATLPWGPSIRRIEGVQVCYYHEPKPEWEMENRICRSINLLSDGKVYASLEDERSLLYRLNY